MWVVLFVLEERIKWKIAKLSPFVTFCQVKSET